MDKLRGIVLIVFGVVAFYRGWRIHNSHTAVLTYALGALALALAIWHFTRPAEASGFRPYRRRARQNDVTPR